MELAPWFHIVLASLSSLAAVAAVRVSSRVIAQIPVDQDLAAERAALGHVWRGAAGALADVTAAHFADPHYAAAYDALTQGATLPAELDEPPADIPADEVVDRLERARLERDLNGTSQLVAADPSTPGMGLQRRAAPTSLALHLVVAAAGALGGWLVAAALQTAAAHAARPAVLLVAGAAGALALVVTSTVLALTDRATFYIDARTQLIGGGAALLFGLVAQLVGGVPGGWWLGLAGGAMVGVGMPAFAWAYLKLRGLDHGWPRGDTELLLSVLLPAGVLSGSAMTSLVALIVAAVVAVVGALAGLGKKDRGKHKTPLAVGIAFAWPLGWWLTVESAAQLWTALAR